MSYWDSNTATVWEPAGYDEFGAPSFNAPVTIQATWKDTGDTQRDDDGQEFVPQSTFWTFSVLQRGWYIAKGDQTATANPSDVQAQVIRKVTEYDMSQFNAPTEYAVMT